ncbi:MAG: hypothetical protein MJE68_18990 [Proteobacteria bacterium]|nr:hypothetical protein [Pseudomonadota bacterium]
MKPILIALTACFIVVATPAMADTRDDCALALAKYLAENPFAIINLQLSREKTAVGSFGSEGLTYNECYWLLHAYAGFPEVNTN